MSNNKPKTSSKQDSTAGKSDLRSIIWQSIAAIPAGKVASYGLIARMTGFPGHARYVGTVLKHLPGNSTLPWHRVLRSNGGLAFPSGSAAWHKQKDLLESEGVVFTGMKVPLKLFQWQPCCN